MTEPQHGPADWDEEVGDFVCQAHGLPECKQTPECERALRPSKQKVIDALAMNGKRLRDLGHAHANLDANARHLIADIVLEALEWSEMAEHMEWLGDQLEEARRDKAEWEARADHWQGEFRRLTGELKRICEANPEPVRLV